MDGNKNDIVNAQLMTMKCVLAKWIEIWKWNVSAPVYVERSEFSGCVFEVVKWNKTMKIRAQSCEDLNGNTMQSH